MAAEKKFRFTQNLTAEQARIIWGILDGACDAGACPDGMTKAESEIAHKMSVALLDFYHAHK